MEGSVLRQGRCRSWRDVEAIQDLDNLDLEGNLKGGV